VYEQLYVRFIEKTFWTLIMNGFYEHTVICMMDMVNKQKESIILVSFEQLLYLFVK